MCPFPMKRRRKLMSKIKTITSILAMLLLFSACAPASIEQSEQPQPTTQAVAQVVAANVTLTITGDVTEEIELEGFGEFATQDMEDDGQSIPTIALTDVLATTQIPGSETSLLFHSPDGVMAEIALDEIDENCRLSLTEETGWTFHAPNHPPQAGIKNMDKIIVVSGVMAQEQACFRIIEDEQTTTLSYGSLFKEPAEQISVLEGDAKKNEYSVQAYTKRSIIPISNYADSVSSALGYFSDGSQQEIEIDGYIEWRGNSADYIAPDAKTRIPGLIGVWFDAPAASITDVPADVEAYDGNTMVILVDGLGYIATNMYTPSFIDGAEISPARSVMPCISNVGLAAMVTGQTPDINGVTERGLRELLVQDMFAGRDAAMIEGHTKLVSTGIEQSLNADENGDGSTDDEVFADAMEAVKAGHELIFVHFHGVDDYSHTYGTHAPETQDKIAEVDGFIKQLTDEFTGKVIITADHGMHDTTGEKIGDHGEFRYEDMTVPYIEFEVN